MGGPNKLLFPFGDTTVIEAVVRTLVGCGLDTLVVTGRDADVVAAAAAPARAVFNAAFESGIGRSIAVGAQECRSEGILIALGDMPNLRADVVQALLVEFQRATEPVIVIPAYSDAPEKPSHPVLFDSAFREELMRLEGDEGARPVIERHPASIRRVLVEGRLDDLDAGPA
jgi:molybdenum cofactor cytidylyltransferase